MAQLTRKFLKALGIEGDDVQDAIISAHVDTLDEIKRERDALKDDAAKLAEAQAQAQRLEGELKAARAAGGDAQKVQKAFDDYKAAVEAEKAKTQKAALLEEALKAAGVQRLSAIKALLKAADVDGLTVKDGKLENADAVIAPLKAEYADFFGTVEEGGVPPQNPPSGGVTGKDAFEKLPLSKQFEYAKAHPQEVAAYLKD